MTRFECTFVPWVACKKNTVEVNFIVNRYEFVMKKLSNQNYKVYSANILICFKKDQQKSKDKVVTTNGKTNIVKALNLAMVWMAICSVIINFWNDQRIYIHISILISMNIKGNENLFRCFFFQFPTILFDCVQMTWE